MTVQSPNRPRPHAAVIGRSIHELDTPALLLDLDACEHNLRHMADFFVDRKSRLRPHFKNHKCATLARRQYEAGAIIGMTCAKVGEAEVLVAHGFDDILIANQVVGKTKMQRLVQLAHQAKISIAVDDQSQVNAISTAAVTAKVTIGLLVEVDIGMGRCGVAPGSAALELARRVVDAPGTKFRGIQAFEGHLIFINDAKKRTAGAKAAMVQAIETRQLLEQHGIAVDVISGGSTANYELMADLEQVEEVQAGTYATMDWRYHEVRPEFQIALTVLATVISKRPGEAVLDVGAKGAGAEFGLPKIIGAPDVDIPHFLAEEHCLVRNAPNWRVGNTVQLLSSHACTTCNLHRQFFVHQDGKVIDVWPIEASGLLS